MVPVFSQLLEAPLAFELLPVQQILLLLIIFLIREAQSTHWPISQPQLYTNIPFLLTNKATSENGLQISKSLDLALWMPDASPLLSSFPAYSIQVANDAVWDSIRAHNTLAQNIPVIRDAATTTTANNEMEIE
eukprot:c12867_g1_i3.p1 GENE.c12867_g1_i3~~c12867_g1_i3.p1  ORF type:complete len:133 (+),score=30.75 c12867_g1_i3:290-688(+)